MMLHCNQLLHRIAIREAFLYKAACPVPCRSPYVTGTSVLAVTYKDGVLVASDTLGELRGFIWTGASGGCLGRPGH